MHILVIAASQELNEALVEHVESSFPTATLSLFSDVFEALRHASVHCPELVLVWGAQTAGLSSKQVGDQFRMYCPQATVTVAMNVEALNLDAVRAPGLVPTNGVLSRRRAASLSRQKLGSVWVERLEDAFDLVCALCHGRVRMHPDEPLLGQMLLFVAKHRPCRDDTGPTA